MRRILWAALILSVAVFVSGCASLRGFERPEVTLVDLGIENVSVFETEGRVTLRVINAADDSLTVTGTAIKLSIDGRKIGRAVSPERIQVDGLSSATIEAPLYISNLAVGRRIYDLLTKEHRELDYEINGKLTLGGGFGGRRIRVKHQGLFEMPERLQNRGSDDLPDDFVPDNSDG